MTRDGLRSRAATLIRRLAGGRRDDHARDALLRDMLAWQAEHVDPYRRLVRARGVDVAGAGGPGAFPALPTDVFRHARVAAHGEELDVRAFRTSGTTSGTRGVHFFRDLALYRLAAQAAADHALFRGAGRVRLILLTPTEREAPDSSLSFMLARFAEAHALGEPTWALSSGLVDAGTLSAALDAACDEGVAAAILGTTFSYVHAEERLGDRRWSLPRGSFLMQTGGFKGRTREVDPDTLRGTLSLRYGVPEAAVVAEYGMTELSSQMYETTLLAPGEPRRLWVPGWVRAVPVDPESLRPVPEGDVGILRVDDAANLDSVAAIQTADLARAVAGGLELLGRAPGAVPRGCSLAVEEALEKDEGAR